MTTSTRIPGVAVWLAAGGGLIQGFDTGGISNASAAIIRHFNLPVEWQGFVTAAVLLGAMPGALAGGPLADRIGRRGALLTCGAVFLLGVALEVTAGGLAWLIAGRLLAGLAIGASSTVAPLYISEVSPPDKRGANLALFQLAVVFGIVCGVLVAMAVGPEAWRVILGAGLVPGGLLLGGMALMPESPAWHASGVKSRSAGRAEFGRPAVELALVVGIGMALIQQVTGINAVMYYAPGIFERAGFSGAGESIWDDLALALLLTVVTFLASRLVDHTGRRALLLVGLGGMVVSFFVLGLGFSLPETFAPAKWIILAALLAFIGFFALGPGPCIWLVIAEIYPLDVRGPAMGIATLASWLANFAVSSTFPAFSLAVGEANAFFIFGLITALSWLFTFASLPETSRRTLDEVQEIWNERAATLFKHHTIQKS
ncbi:MAG: MFS transporter [Terrimicrobiaceae bacterium]|nr:MFS transporter [Terrimicrobiaceae bacterium]